jgi:tetratricopeptide (TPR) repeat protein
VRRVLEALARRRPLVLVVDDLQWAEPVFVELVERVAEWTRDAPLLLLIMARNELLDARPDWGGGKLNATTILLEPLPDNDARDLVRNLVGPERLDGSGVERILALAEGNPLFVEEGVAMMIDDGGLQGERAGPAQIAVPPTIHALIAARLDRLGAGERAVIEAAAIEGKEFTRKRVQALVTDGASELIGAHLRALVRKDLIRPLGPHEDSFRFRHQLIRDAAYAGMSKELRADLHERFADGLESTDPSVALVLDELLGYHLECAAALRRDLGDAGPATAALAARAATSLRAAARRAAQRDDPASVRLLERALSLTPEAERAPVLAELAEALSETGDLTASGAAASTAIELARSAGDRRTIARARVVELRASIDRLKGDSALVAADAAARRVLEETEALGDDEGMAAVLLLLGNINMNNFERAWDYNERALAAAERAGDRKKAAFARGSLGLITAFGPVPAEEGVARCRALRSGVPPLAGSHAFLLRHEAVLRRCGATSTWRAHSPPMPTGSSTASASRGPWRDERSASGRSRCSPARRIAPRPPRARASRSSSRWARRMRVRPLPRCSPLRSLNKAVTTRRCTTPTWPRHGRCRMTSRRKSGSSAPGQLCSRPAATSIALRRRRARPCDCPNSRMRSRSAEMPSSVSPRCSNIAGVPAKRPRR